MEQRWRVMTAATPSSRAANTPGGVGSVANKGMDAAPQRRITSPSSTRTTSWRTALAQLVEAAQTNDADVVLGDWFRTTKTAAAPTTSRRPAHFQRHGLHRRATPASVAASPVPWRKLYGADYLRTNDVKFPTGDHFVEDNAFHWRALTASKDAKVAYTGTPVVAHTVGDARQTTAGIDGADAEKLGGYFPNLNAIAAELLADKAPSFLLREFASFLSRSKWIVSRQQDPQLRAKFARILQEPRAASSTRPHFGAEGRFTVGVRGQRPREVLRDDEAPRVEYPS